MQGVHLPHAGASHFIKSEMSPSQELTLFIREIRMGDAPAFMIKGDAHAFRMIDRMGDALAFMIKGDTPLAAHISFT
jgi:hypothetical protein